MNNSTTHGISSNKIQHMLGVARKCEQLAKEKGLSTDMQTACFIMGFLHDIGYEYCDKTTPCSHANIGYSMLCDFEKYKYEILSAIKQHGNKYENLTIFDEILNTADLTINYQGEETTIEKRLDDIKRIHGENTLHYKHACDQAETIQKLINNTKE